MSTPHRALIGLLALTLLAGCQAPERGTWFWRSSSSPYGSDAIVGDSTAEAATVSFLQSQDITRVYGSYGPRTEPSGEPAVIAAWNARLDDAGIASDLLLSENTWIYPSVRPNLHALIDNRLIAFNQAHPGDEAFDGLHLDIEPQALDAWDTGTPAEKRDLLFLLADTLTAVRAQLDAKGESALPLAADLAVWWDSSASIGWTSTSDRDAFFAQVSAACASVSLMAYERDTPTEIYDGTVWEVEHMSTEVLVALDVDIPGTWPDLATLDATAAQVELLYPTMPGVDIHALTDLIVESGGL